MTNATSAQLLAAHRAAGRFFTAAGVGSFVLDAGAPDAEPVVCVHGVPASAFLYRKLVPALAEHGRRGIAVDLPGLGLAERPADADYSWTGLGRWLSSAVDALGLDRFHLMVHDIGGPIGFELAAADPGRVRSLTLLNTIVAVETFHRPWMMEPFAHRGVGEAWPASVRLPGMFLALMRYVGVSRHVSTAEIACYLPLLLGTDRRGGHRTRRDGRRSVAAHPGAARTRRQRRGDHCPRHLGHRSAGRAAVRCDPTPRRAARRSAPPARRREVVSGIRCKEGARA